MASQLGFTSSSTDPPYTDTVAPLRGPIPSMQSSTATTTSQIRPRNRRGLSGSTELAPSSDLGLGIAGISSATARDASPIPGKHPSRISSSRTRGNSNGTPVGGLVDIDGAAGGAGGNGSPSMGFGRGLWGGVWTGSWSAVQGLASSYLGADVGEGGSGVLVDAGVGGGARKGVGKGKGVAVVSKAKAPTSWGPSGLRLRGDSLSAGGGAVEREAALNARKTASVLESHEGVNGGLDVSGNYKRRNSMEAPGSPGVEEEALCYVHHVLATDTQSGIVLKYQCLDSAAFRKANRLYPNDPVQLRKVVLLPVETCTIKGRPCDGPGDVDLLAPTPSYEDGPDVNGSSPWGANQEQANPFAPSPSQAPQTADENPWTHVRWVLLSASPSSKPTEIVRLPRKTLGFFPPRRRKSASRLSTPRSSIDLLLPDSPFGTPSRQLSNLNPNAAAQAGAAGSYFPPSSSHHVSSLSASASLSSPPPFMRHDSISSNASLSSTRPEGRSALPHFMRRPGGVGTMNRNVRAPGPAQDGFNAWATRQFPTLTIDHLPSTSSNSSNAARVAVENLGFGFSDELASIDELPNISGVNIDGTAAGGSVAGNWDLGIGSAAAGLEGWVRKSLAKASGPGTPKLKASTLGNAHGMGIGVGVIDGDLIELLDGTGSDDGRGFEPLPTAGSAATRAAARSFSVGSAAAGGSGRDDLLGLGGAAGSGVRGRVLGGKDKGKSE